MLLSQFRMTPLSGVEGFGSTKKEDYWDLKTDGVKIHTALKSIWNFRCRLLPRPPG